MWSPVKVSGRPRPTIGEASETAEEKILRFEVDRALEAIKEVLRSTDAEFGSRSFMLSKLKKVGISYNNWYELARWVDWKNLSMFGVQQIPSEYIDFLMYISSLGIKTGVEVGVWYGASSYFTSAVLQRANPEFKMTMVDVQDNLVAYEKFSGVLNLEKRVPATAADCSGEVFDFVFIDGDHAYDSVQCDYLMLGRHARIACGFHDIYAQEFNHLEGGTARFWQEFAHHHCQEMTIIEFKHFPQPWMGIGLAVKEVLSHN